MMTDRRWIAQIYQVELDFPRYRIDGGYYEVRTFSVFLLGLCVKDGVTSWCLDTTPSIKSED